MKKSTLKFYTFAYFTKLFARNIVVRELDNFILKILQTALHIIRKVFSYNLMCEFPFLETFFNPIKKFPSTAE